MVVTLGQQYNIGEKPTVILYTYITLITMQGQPDKNKTKTFLVHNKIYSNSAIDPYTVKAYSLEHKQCYDVVIDKEKYIYQVHFYKSVGTFYYVYKVVVS